MQCVMLSFLNSQGNSWNHFYARRVNTFRKLSQWLIPWRMCQWQLEPLQCCSHWEQCHPWGVIGGISPLCFQRVGLRQPPASWAPMRAPSCLCVKGCSLPLREASPQHKAAVPAPQHAKYMAAGVSRIFCHFRQTLNNGCDECWILTGLCFHPNYFILGSLKDMLCPLGRKSQHSYSGEDPMSLPWHKYWKQKARSNLFFTNAWKVGVMYPWKGGC